MMELKEYQQNALDTFSRWLETLEEAQRASETLIEAFEQTPTDIPIPDELRNYPKDAWRRLRENGGVAATAGEYVDRTDDANRPIPHICFKVPTGGGKTLLAAAALERLRRQRGLVLWIVPSKAIYNQTKAALWDKQHPYRKIRKTLMKHIVDTVNKLNLTIKPLDLAGRVPFTDSIELLRVELQYHDGYGPLFMGRVRYALNGVEQEDGFPFDLHKGAFIATVPIQEAGLEEKLQEIGPKIAKIVYEDLADERRASA